jgi:asparagine synthase (glutamine-hydrolysing)
MDHLSRAVGDRGSSLHLIGLGGDELFTALPAYLRSIVRRNPLGNLRAAGRFRARNRWTVRSTVRGLADRTDFARSLARTAGAITGPPPGPYDAPLGWRQDPLMPPWASADAVQTVRRMLRETAAEGPVPLDADRGQHQCLEGVITSGAAIRQMRSAQAPSGVRWEAPFLDDRVIEAALSVRMEERAVPGRYKPVLVAAMRGVLPDPLRNRRSKGEYSAEAYEGLLRNRRVLLELCDDLHLARLGLADPDRLRDALLSPGPQARHLVPFENTLACETWLRAASGAADQGPLTAGGRP